MIGKWLELGGTFFPMETEIPTDALWLPLISCKLVLYVLMMTPHLNLNGRVFSHRKNREVWLCPEMSVQQNELFSPAMWVVLYSDLINRSKKKFDCPVWSVMFLELARVKRLEAKCKWTDHETERTWGQMQMKSPWEWKDLKPNANELTMRLKGLEV